MLLHLSVRNVATLADIEVDFPEGLVVLTGETGSGKSLILESLRFALGRRAKGSLIREGADMAEVIAVFGVPNPHPVRAALHAALDSGIRQARAIVTIHLGVLVPGCSGWRRHR